MLELDSLDLQLEGLMSASFEALTLVTEQAEVAHGEDPALCIADGLPRLLLKRYDEGGRCHIDRDSGIAEVLLQALRDLLHLAGESLVLRLSRKFCLVGQPFHLEESGYVADRLGAVDYLERLELEHHIQVVLVFVF